MNGFIDAEQIIKVRIIKTLNYANELNGDTRTFVINKVYTMRRKILNQATYFYYIRIY